MPRLYNYVGPAEIRERSRTSPPGVVIRQRSDLMAWLQNQADPSNRSGNIIATFVIDSSGRLRLAPRQSEHVACADGGPVQSAGEISLTLSGEVVEISNHSTGFCPEPESWPACEAALDRLTAIHPGQFTREVIFRRCPDCGERNILKDDWFVCDLCGGELPADWNFSLREAD